MILDEELEDYSDIDSDNINSKNSQQLKNSNSFLDITQSGYAHE